MRKSRSDKNVEFLDRSEVDVYWYTLAVRYGMWVYGFDPFNPVTPRHPVPPRPLLPRHFTTINDGSEIKCLDVLIFMHISSMDFSNFFPRKCSSSFRSMSCNCHGWEYSPLTRLAISAYVPGLVRGRFEAHTFRSKYGEAPALLPLWKPPESSGSGESTEMCLSAPCVQITWYLLIASTESVGPKREKKIVKA